MALSFTDRELDVMAVLWRRGSGTVAEVREALSEDFAYTTVLTVLRTLEDKGYVGHTAEGKAHRYHPLVKQETAGKHALARLLDTVFAGSREQLLTPRVSDRGGDAATLEKLRAMLDEQLATKKPRRP
jgi:predicted transcriptional regulator